MIIIIHLNVFWYIVKIKIPIVWICSNKKKRIAIEKAQKIMEEADKSIANIIGSDNISKPKEKIQYFTNQEIKELFEPITNH